MDWRTNLLGAVALVMQLNMVMAFTSSLFRHNTGSDFYSQSRQDREANRVIKMQSPHLDINTTHVLGMELLDQLPMYAPAPGPPFNDGMPLAGGNVQPFVPAGVLAPAPDDSFSPRAPPSSSDGPHDIMLPSPPLSQPTPGASPGTPPAQAIPGLPPGVPPIYIQIPNDASKPGSIVPIIVNMPGPAPAAPQDAAGTVVNETSPEDHPSGLAREGDKPTWYSKVLPWPIKTPLGNLFPFTEPIKLPEHSGEPLVTPWGDFYTDPHRRNHVFPCAEKNRKTINMR